MRTPNNDTHFPYGDVDGLPLLGSAPPTLDNVFLEYVWRLLIRHPDIRIEEGEQSFGPSLEGTEVKANYGPAQIHGVTAERLRANVSALAASIWNTGEAASAAHEAVHGHAPEIGALENRPANAARQTHSQDIDQPSQEVQPTLPSEHLSGRPTLDFVDSARGRGIRLLASESRIWRTIAGHEPDYARIQGLDFICLSIIAAHGSRGIAQNDLVRISGQDKRSLPLRTDRLHNNDYIIKRPVTIYHNNALLHTSLLTLKRYADSSETTAMQLTEAANNVQKDTRSKKRRAIAKAYAADQGQDSVTGEAMRLGALQVDEPHDVHSTPMTDVVTQWTPDRNLWNQIFDIVQQSSMAGITLNGISTILMGPRYKKPMEDLLAKLTNTWQLSQPLHLRHLAIVRDSVQQGKTSVYIYYTFENYQKLVDAGQKTWEAVMMLQDNKKQSKGIGIAPGDPQLDEYGLPKLDSSQFQGLRNNASLIECVSVTKFGTLKRPNPTDSPSTTQGRSSIPCTPAKLTASTGKRKGTTAISKRRGRPRIYPTTGIPTNIKSWSFDDIKGLIDSRRMHENYQKTKITDGIQHRAEQGEEVVSVAHELLEATDALRREQGQEPMSKFLVMQILHEYAGGPKPLQEDKTILELRKLLEEAETQKYPRGKWPRQGRPTKSTSGPDDDILVPLQEGDVSTMLASVGTRPRRPPKAFDESPVLHHAAVKHTRVRKTREKTLEEERIVPNWQLPSVAAHSQLRQHTPLSYEETRSPNEGPIYWHLPSVAAHSKPHYSRLATKLAVNHTLTTKANAKKRGRLRQALDTNADSTIEMPTPKRQKIATSKGFNIITTPTPETFIVEPLVPTEATSQSSTPACRPSPSIIHGIMAEKYIRALDSILRPCDGIYVTKPAQRYRRRDDPVSMTSKKYQIVIFKLTALNNIDWFTKDHPSTPSSTSDHHQRPEQTTRMEQPSPEVPLSSGLTDLLVETPLSKNAISITNLNKAISPKDRELSHYFDVNGDAMETNLVAGKSSSTLEARHWRALKAPSLTSTQASPNLSRPQVSNKRTARARPELGNLIPRDTLAPIPPASSSHRKSSHGLSGGAIPDLTVEESILAADRELNNERSSIDPGLWTPISNSQLLAHVPESTNSYSTRFECSQRSACFVFKSPRLREFYWFRQDSMSSRVKNRNLPHNLAEAVSAAEVKSGKGPITESKSPDASYYTAPAMEEQTLAIPQHARTPRKSRVHGTTGRTGGSTAILRRDIVIHLVKKNGGVYPDASAMRLPFGQEWKERGQPGVPERTTVSNAINMCCGQGKLRRIVFSFKDRYGITTTSTVFALPDVDPGDPKIRELQEMVKERHPRVFVPNARKPKDPAVEGLRKTKRQQTLLEAAEKQAKIDEARAIALKSPEEREAYLTALQSSNRSEQEKQALARLTEPSARKIQRLGTIRKPEQSSNQTDGRDSSGQLFSLSQDRNFFDATMGVGRPSNQGFSRTLRPPEVRDDESIIQGEHARQRIRGLAKNAAQIERDQRNSIQADLYLHHGGLNELALPPKENIVSGYMDPMIENHELSGTFSNTFSGAKIAKVPSEQVARSRKRKHGESEQQVFPGFMDPTLMYHRATGTFSATFPGFRNGMAKLNVRGRREQKSRPRVPLGYQSPFPSDQPNETVLLRGIGKTALMFPGIMSPNALHSSSGTFSQKFLEFRPTMLRVPEAVDGRGGGRQNSRLMKTAIEIETEDPKGRKRKRHQAGSIAEASGVDEAAEPSLDLLSGSPVKLRRVRGPQTAKTLGEDGALRLSIAVMVVRILTGGIRMTIDWKLVAKVFAPMHDESFIRSKWGAVLTQMRHNQVKMDADFQALFTRAYEEGAVPKLDFEHLEDYDWKWLVEWTMTHLDAPSDSAPELLVARASFDRRYSIKDASQEKDLSHFYEFEGFSVKDLRKSIINRQAHVCHLYSRNLPPHASKAHSGDEQTVVARSWIRASLVTPLETYSSHVAQTKLNNIPVATVETILKSLLQEKVIIEKSKSRNVQGYDYEISDFFEKRLRTNIAPSQFHRAAMFKAQLDQAVEAEGRMRWNFLAHDGDAMALLNLVAQQQVKIVPIDPPLNMWGHTDDGYASRQMDKSKLNFEMDVVPMPSYIIGNPLEPLSSPPAPHLNVADQQSHKIPIWYDLNDDLVPKMWTPVLAGVLGLLAIRSGATAEELQVNIRPSLEVWEVEEVLHWMVEADVAEKVGANSFKTKEWWWMALGKPSEVDTVSDGYKLGFASMTDKATPAKRRYHRAEEQDKKNLASSFRPGTSSQDAGGTPHTQDEDRMDIG